MKLKGCCPICGGETDLTVYLGEGGAYTEEQYEHCLINRCYDYYESYGAYAERIGIFSSVWGYSDNDDLRFFTLRNKIHQIKLSLMKKYWLKIRPFWKIDNRFPP